MTSEHEVVEGELLPDVYEQPPGPLTLFGSDPQLALVRMGDLADALMHVVRDRKLAVRIRGKEFLTIEAWVTLGALVGVHASIVWTKPNETGDGIIARAEARTLNGALVGAGEAECSRVEQHWKHAEPHAVRAMSQTRALSRALQAPLRHIAVLAGYAGASAEEMPDTNDNVVLRADGKGKLPPEVRATRDQLQRVGVLVAKLEQTDPETDWRAKTRAVAGVSADMLTKASADGLIRQLEQLLTYQRLK